MLSLAKKSHFVTTYAIGDVQGCADALDRLLEKLRFDPAADQLWFCGDLVNRGGQSLQSLRLIYSLRDNVVATLGNHDLSLLRSWLIKERPTRSELRAVFDAPEADELMHWLHAQPLMVLDQSLGYAMTHAGAYPTWSLEQTFELATEAKQAFMRATRDQLRRRLFGKRPRRWRPSLTGWRRTRFVINALTRTRFLTRSTYAMNFGHKGGPESAPSNLAPWFELRKEPWPVTHVFGHWSTLGLHRHRGVIGLDTGLVWGGALTAVSLDEEQRIISVTANEATQRSTA